MPRPRKEFKWVSNVLTALQAPKVKVSGLSRAALIKIADTTAADFDYWTLKYSRDHFVATHKEGRTLMFKYYSDGDMPSKITIARKGPNKPFKITQSELDEKLQTTRDEVFQTLEEGERKLQETIDGLRLELAPLQATNNLLNHVLPHIAQLVAPHLKGFVLETVAEQLGGMAKAAPAADSIQKALPPPSRIRIAMLNCSQTEIAEMEKDNRFNKHINSGYLTLMKYDIGAKKEMNVRGCNYVLIKQGEGWSPKAPKQIIQQVTNDELFEARSADTPARLRTLINELVEGHPKHWENWCRKYPSRVPQG